MYVHVYIGIFDDLGAGGIFESNFRSPKFYVQMSEEEALLMSVDDLLRTPSSLSGVPWETEERFRLLGCHLIHRAGLLLGLPQSAITKAHHLLHQFYLGRSVLEVAVLDLAMAALFVAGKVEEAYRRVRDLINVFYRIYTGLRREEEEEEPLGYVSNEYYEWRQRLTRTEMVLLAQLGFHLSAIPNPTILLVNYLRALQSASSSSAMTDDGGWKEFSQDALALLNDSGWTVACLRWPSRVLAAACIKATAEERGMLLPMNPPWFAVFDVVAEDLEACQRFLGRTYQIKLDTQLPLTPVELKVYGSVFEEMMMDMRSTAKEPRQPTPKRTRSRSPQSRSRHHSTSYRYK